MLERLTAGMLGISVIFGASVTPAVAQTRPAAPSPAPVLSPAPMNAPASSAAPASSSAPAATGSGTSSSPGSSSTSSGSSSSSSTSNAGQPGATSQSVGSDGGQALPPPPIPPVLPKVPAIAPGYAAPANAPLPTGDLVGVNQEPFVGIGLQDAITMALERNTDLAISESNNRISNFEIVAAKGVTDVQFQVQPSYSHTVEPATSPFNTGPNGGPITVITDGIAAGFTGQTVNGGRYSLTGSQQAIQNNNAYNSYNPFYQTAIALQFTQPLLRGSGAGSDARRQIVLANANLATQTSQVLTSASATVTNVENTYWDLVAAWRNVGIQEEGLRNAQAQAASNGRLARSGAAAPVDVVESYTQINVFQDNVFSALQRVQALQTQIKQLILANPADPLWQANLVPTSAVLQVPAEPKLDDLIVTALKNRPEIAQLRSERLVAAANLAYFKNQKQPRLDLTGGITASGYSGVPTTLTGTPFFQTIGGEITALNQLIAQSNATATPANQIPLLAANFGTTPAYQTGKLGQSYQNLIDFRNPTYSVSLTLAFPLANRTAKAQYAIADEQAKQIALQELSLLQRVRAEAVNAIQSLRETQYRLIAAGAARAAAARVLLAEQRRFGAGTSTTFLVLQRQLDLANTEGRELQAQTDLNKAVAQLDSVGGTNFTAYNIDIKTSGSKTLDAVTATTTVLPLPADAQVSPPPLHR